MQRLHLCREQLARDEREREREDWQIRNGVRGEGSEKYKRNELMEREVITP